jgi:SAM-dependent MidA family methyltransferase
MRVGRRVGWSPVSILEERLHSRIATEGPLSFHDFMAAALYDPAQGYYASGKVRIGRQGDFITSVSVGSHFGALLARQLIEVWELLGRPAPFEIVEQGAHDGTLAADILAGLERFAPKCWVKLTIVEPVALWRAKQAERLAGRLVTWVRDVESLDPFAGVHFSNELVDAFPVHRVRRVGDGWMEQCVSSSAGVLVFVDRPIASERLAMHLEKLPPLPEGIVTEVNLDALDWVEGIASKITRGVVLAIDYGHPRADYYVPHRREGTLEAAAAHRREFDPLSRPGEMDLTAHVDFTSLAEAAEAAGLRTLGFTDQHHFLVGLSQLHFAEGTQPDPVELRAFQMLAHPTMLGRTFKVLGLGRGIDATLAGFAFAREPRAALGLP